MQIAINPGSGPVSNSTYENAEANIRHYITDCGLKRIRYIHLDDKDSDGRYCFMLFEDDWDSGVHHFVDMPGPPLNKVRFVEGEGLNPWHFPRLYIDGSSWLWCFAMLTQKDFDIPTEEDFEVEE